MANVFTSVSVQIRWDNARMVSWTMLPGADYPSDFILEVENSRAGGPWTVLETNLQNACCFIDSRKRNYNKRANDFYRVRMRVPSTKEVYVSEIVDAGNHKAYPYSSEAENIVSQAEKQIELSGCTGVLLKKKQWGVRCPDCTDFDGQQTVNEHCPRCLGTGIDGGYFPGIPLALIKDGIDVSEADSGIGYMQSETVHARCIAYPYISRGDVWVEDGTNRRYMISKASPAASYKTTTLVYSLSMSAIEQHDVMFSAKADALYVQADEQPTPEASTMPQGEFWDEVLERP